MMTSMGSARRLALLGIVFALALSLATVFAACGSEEPEDDGERAATPRTEATETTEAGDPEPTREGILGAGSQSTADAEEYATEAAETGEPEPTRQGIFGAGSQSAAEPEATGEPRPAATRRPLLTFGATSAATDREALVVLYNATDGPNWDYDENWLSNAPLDEWYGVTTNNGGRVTELSLDGNELTGEIPPELGSLASLTELRLDGNELNGEIPPELGSLANLMELDLDLNDLSGEIPPEMGSLANLEVLYLGWNDLSGEIPPELGSLANLTKLVLSSNQLNGEIPLELSSLANLTWLHLSSNQLSGRYPRNWAASPT